MGLGGGEHEGRLEIYFLGAGCILLFPKQKFGPAEYSVGKKKLKALAATMNAFLYEHTELPNIWNLDLVVVENFVRGEPPVLLHFRSVKIDD